MALQRSTAWPQPVQRKLRCPLCGGDGIATITHRHTFQHGLGESAFEVTVTLPVRRCDPCDIEYLDEVGEELKHTALCEHFGVLTPNEIRRIREHHGMTRARFAELTGIGEASLNRWENALNIQTHAYDRYLRLLALPGIMQRLKEIVEKRPSLTMGTGDVDGRFRRLEVTDDMLRGQESFRLRPAA